MDAGLARALGLQAAQVTVLHRQGAGAYGHNTADDAAFDAAFLAIRHPGRTVRVQWPREDEFGASPISTAMAIKLRAVLDQNNRPADWTIELWSPPHAQRPGVRTATIADHLALHALHAQKPWAVQRTPQEMSGLLTTPGAYTFVLERAHGIAAYAVCGKGADLQGWWHEVGGADADVVELLQGAMHLLDVPEAVMLLPPYRTGLAATLGGAACETFAVDGPMRLAHTPRGAMRLFVDGLDSV